jgi:hypothetical protein
VPFCFPIYLFWVVCRLHCLGHPEEHSIPNSAVPNPLRADYALNAVMTLLARLGTDVGTDALDYAALGVFFRFQVSDFDRRLGFFSLCHFIFPSYLFLVVCCCVVSVTPKGN